MVLAAAHMTANKNTCPGDKSAMVPGGLRFGTPALTTRNFTEDDFRAVAHLIHEGVGIALEAKGKAGKTVKKFREFVATDADTVARIGELGDRVIEFAGGFPFPADDIPY